MKKIEYLKIIYALAILAAFCTGLYFIFSIPDTDVTEVSEEYVVIPTTYATVEDAVKAEAYEYYEQQETTAEQAQPETAKTQSLGVHQDYMAQSTTQNENIITDEELDILLRCVEAEAGNQSLEGRQLVADVILNRVKDGKWPDTITEVIKKPYEFESYWNGAMARVIVSDLTRQAVELELEEIGYPGLFYFTAGRYNKWGTPWKQVGDHYFSTK